ncbi:hypothetical protein SEA_CAMERICO_83 [Gordonia phage Camerico]|nr:hypothetical protein SEA_CAMERICO_83 [Gordonia phage Camerico]
MRITVAIVVEVSEEEWMGRYGDHIVANGLVPEVTLEKATRNAAREGLEKLGFETLAVDKPYNTKPKVDKGFHS